MKIFIHYDKTLQEITGKPYEEAEVSENMPFLQMLYFIFSSYPEIPEKYKPGALGLLINDRPPVDDQILHDGDRILLLKG